MTTDYSNYEQTTTGRLVAASSNQEPSEDAFGRLLYKIFDVFNNSKYVAFESRRNLFKVFPHLFMTYRKSFYLSVITSRFGSITKMHRTATFNFLKLISRMGIGMGAMFPNS